MTRQLTSAVRHRLLRSPHAKRPPHGRLSSSRLTGQVESVIGTCPVTAFIVQVDYFRAVMRAKSREATPIGREGGRFYAYPAS